MNKKKDTMELLQNELSSLEGSVLSEFHPLAALKIAGSRIDIARSTQKEEDMRKAIEALETAKTIYRLYGEGNLAEPLSLTNEMRMRLSIDHPSHYLVQD